MKNKLSPEIENIYNLILQESELNPETKKSGWDCAYIRLPHEVRDQMLDWIRVNIPTEWIYEDPNDSSYGVEKESHVTLLYGLDPADCNAQLVQNKMLEHSFQPIRFSLEEIGVFSADMYVVLKIEAQGKDLHHINGFLKDTFKNHNTHPTYNPHATLCYIKKEHENDVKQFVGDRIFRLCEMTAKSFIYANQRENKQEIKLFAEEIEGARDAEESKAVAS